MKNNSSVIVNQSYEYLHKQKDQSSTLIKGDEYNKLNDREEEKKSNFNNTNNILKSITTVLEQALTTKDKLIIKQLLSTIDQQTMQNTVKGISSSKLHSLFEQIQILLLEDCKDTKNTLIYLEWIKKIMKVHFGSIINNPEIQVVMGRISMIVKKRAQNIKQLEELHARIATRVQSNLENKFIPKFQYIEEENDVVHGKQDNDDEIDEENFDEGQFMDMEDDFYA